MAKDWSTPPLWMRNDGARELWPELVAELRERNKLAAATVWQVAWFCQILAIYLQAYGEVSVHGVVDEFSDSEGRPKLRLPSAEAKVLFTALSQLRNLTKELGLNDVPLAPPGRPAAGSTPRDQLRHALGQIAAGGLN